MPILLSFFLSQFINNSIIFHKTPFLFQYTKNGAPFPSLTDPSWVEKPKLDNQLLLAIILGTEHSAFHNQAKHAPNSNILNWNTSNEKEKEDACLHANGSNLHANEA